MGTNHEVNSVTLDDDGAGKTNTKQPFKSTRNVFKKLLQNFIEWNFLVTNCLPA